MGRLYNRSGRTSQRRQRSARGNVAPRGGSRPTARPTHVHNMNIGQAEGIRYIATPHIHSGPQAPFADWIGDDGATMIGVNQYNRSTLPSGPHQHHSSTSRGGGRRQPQTRSGMRRRRRR